MEKVRFINRELFFYMKLLSKTRKGIPLPHEKSDAKMLLSFKGRFHFLGKEIKNGKRNYF